MKRLHTQSVPNSNNDATASALEGYTTAQHDQIGGIHASTRQLTATGIICPNTNPRGHTITSLAAINECVDWVLS